MGRTYLRALAADVGILPSYVDQAGVRRHTSDVSRVALLAAMGVDASTERAAKRAWERRRQHLAERLVAPVRVVSGPTPRHRRLRVWPDRRAPAPRSGAWQLALEQENGVVHRAEGRLRELRSAGGLVLELPADLPLGYHTLRLKLQLAGGEEHGATQFLVRTPSHCPRYGERFDRRQLVGLMTNLYTLRSRQNWGVGDLTDLRDLCSWAHDIDAAFVGVNPLHAVNNRGVDVSPYSPVSRLFWNVIYLDVTAVPDLADAPRVLRTLGSAAIRRELAQLRTAAHVDYERILQLKQRMLRELHSVFLRRHRDQNTARGRDYRRFLQEQGQPLADFATFVALQEHFGREGKPATDWHAWPSSYRSPRSPAVRAFWRAHRDQVDFHCYLQFETDRQLARAAANGLPLGLYQDLAIGTSPCGSDTWMFPRLFLAGVSMGAPPDNFQPEGQNWGLPPIDPSRLMETRYDYWVRLVRGALRHAGAARIDHVMGLFRQFWIPSGFSGKDGAYVRMPSDHLLGILALESVRAEALIVGEDLGTVPPGLPDVLERWGIISTRVLYFERGRRGSFRSARAYRQHALVSVNTHDLVPLAGFWSGRDIELRRQLRTLPTAKAVAEAEKKRARERRLLVERLVREGLLPAGRKPTGARDLCTRVHAFLRRTPAALVGLSFDDLVGEVEPVNLPGVSQDRHPSWTRRMKRTLEAIVADPTVRRALAVEASAGQGRGKPKGSRRRRKRVRLHPGDQGA